MLRILVCTLAVAVVVAVIHTQAALAVDVDTVLGSWECLDTEEGRLIWLELREDGLFSADVYEYEPGVYKIDKEKHLVGVRESGSDTEFEWVSYKIKGNKMVIIPEGMDDGMEMAFERIWKPKKTKNHLVGRWTMIITEEMSEMDIGLPGEFIIQFNNDSTAGMLEWDEQLTGEFVIDGNGTVELTIEDEIGNGEYDAESDTLTVWVDGESYTFNRQS